MGLFHNLTRGGQVHIHQIRMIRQVLWFGMLVAFGSGSGYFVVKTSITVPPWAWQTIWEYHVAGLNVATQPDAHKGTVTQTYVPPQGRPFVRRSLSILTDRAVLETVTLIEQSLQYLFWQSIKISGWSFLASLFGWGLMGWHHRRKRLHRGNALVSPKTLARKLRWTFKASDLKLGTLPLVKGSETRHILISGAIGSGKSNTFHTLLPQIRKRGNRALVVDVEGEMVSRYYREGHDILLNPFDARSVYWDLWRELESEPLYQVFASAVIPPLKGVKDPLWENAARKVLIAALKKCKENGDTCPQKLYTLLVYANSADYEAFFDRTEAATFTQEKGEKFTLSIRASLEQHLDFFKYLPPQQNKRSFSLRQWVHHRQDDSWVFLSSKEDFRLSLIPLLSGWTDLVMSSFMSLPKDLQRRLWIVLDELPALHALPCMLNSLARTRKYGGCVLAGVQNFRQLELAYGRTEREVLMDLFSTKVFFRNSEQGTAEWVARSLGEQEETEVLENLSYGANTTRDGVSLNQQTKRTPLVLPTEITLLKDFEAFIKLPGKYPVTRLKIPLVKRPEQALEFVPRPSQVQETLPLKEEPLPSHPDAPERDPTVLDEKCENLQEENAPMPINLSFKDLPVPFSTPSQEQDQGFSFRPESEQSQETNPPMSNVLEKVDAGVRERYQNVLRLLLKEAERGRIYTASSFALRFEGLGTFGSSAGLLDILKALSAKNIVKYFINGEEYGFEHCKKGYVWIPGMKILRPDLLDAQGGEVFIEPVPTHYRDLHTGLLKKIEEDE